MIRQISRTSLWVAVLLLLSTPLLAAAPGGRLFEDEGGAPALSEPVLPNSFSGFDTTTYTDEATFLGAANCTVVNLESFEGEPPTSTSDQSSIALADFTITEIDSPNMGVWNVPQFGGSATDGTQWVGFSYCDDGCNPDIKTLSFSSPINTFGFNISDYGDFGSGNLELANDIGEVFTAATSGGPDGNLLFFGMINNEATFTTITLSATISGEFYGIDEVYYCSAPMDADLEISKSGVVAGNTVTYTVSVFNNGPNDATGVSVTDMIPAELTYVSDDCGGMNTPPWTWNLGNLANGASATCVITTTINSGVVGPIVNTATVSGDQTDPAPGNESDTATVTSGSVLDIPTLGGRGLAVLLLVLAGAGALLLRRR